MQVSSFQNKNQAHKGLQKLQKLQIHIRRHQINEFKNLDPIMVILTPYTIENLQNKKKDNLQMLLKL